MNTQKNQAYSVSFFNLFLDLKSSGLKGEKSWNIIFNIVSNGAAAQLT